MKLPALTAERSLGPATTTYGGWPAPMRRGATGPALLVPMATQSCLTSCVGSSAAQRCAAQCGGDLTCWRTCAGPRNVDCVADCFAY